MALAGKPVLFLDRDGTVIENMPYLDDPRRVAIIPGAKETITAFRSAGFAVILVTNQSGIARGYCSPERYRAVEAAVIAALGDGLVDATYVCPFFPEHPWRKPEAGMLLAAAKDHALALAGSIMVGDTLDDMKAGAAAGVATLVHVRTGHGRDQRGAVEAWHGEAGAARLSPLRLVESIGALFPERVEG